MRILIIEDEQSVAQEIALALQKWDFTPILIHDFQNILQEFQNAQAHLVLMDVNLPSRDGFYWCARIREFSHVPILFLSSRNADMDKIMAMGNGGDDYISKPFSIDVLIAKIQAMLRRSYDYQISNTFMYNENIMLEVEKGIMIVYGQNIELTKNELRILSVLLKHPKRIVSREDLMMALWNTDEFVNDNSLTVNINRLRTKLADAGLVDFILTKKGIGYYIS